MYLFYIGLLLSFFYFETKLLMMFYYIYNLYKNNNQENVLKASFIISITLFGVGNTFLYLFMYNIIGFLEGLCVQAHGSLRQ